MKINLLIILILISGLFFISPVNGEKEEDSLPEVLIYKDTEMILISEGNFWMGSQVETGDLDEHPQHKVFLDSFYIDKYEVTNEEFCKFLNAMGNHREDEDWWIVINDSSCLIELKDSIYSPVEGFEKFPVTSVTWDGANSFARWLGKELPTEAEWEKAAKGTEGYTYPWGINWDPEKCNNKSLINEELLPFMTDFYNQRGLLPVGSIPKGNSPYGLMDMAGNVKEWCSDWYDKDYYALSPYKNPIGPKNGVNKVIRGGSWENSDSYDFRCNNRYIIDFDRGYSVGFRCVLHLKKN